MAGSFRVPDHVRAVTDADGAILLDVRQGKYFSLNGIALDIWQHIEAGRTLDEIEAHLAATYEAPAEVLRADLLEFVARLQQGRLVQAHA